MALPGDNAQSLAVDLDQVPMDVARARYDRALQLTVLERGARTFFSVMGRGLPGLDWAFWLLGFCQLDVLCLAVFFNATLHNYLL